jgi:general secretion pathway protein C
MEALLRRHLWVVDLVGIVIGAALAGHATATFIGALLPQPSMSASGRARPPAPPASPGEKCIGAIVARDIFGATRGAAPSAERSRRALTLLAVMFAPPPSDPRWSVAIVRDDETATTGPYGVGARLGDATIDAIEQVRVVLDVGNGRRELLELLRDRPRARPDAAPDVSRSGIRQTGAHSYEVRRAALEQFLAGGLSTAMPRLVPQVRDGQPAGFRLAGVGGEGPFAALGLANGDVLLEVNGRPITSPDTAFAAYSALRTASHVWLVIERGGERIRMGYAIR